MKKAKNFVLALKQALNIPAVKRSRRCPMCNSKHLDDGYWIRGWNDLCSQACGDIGTRCFDCGHIEWKQSCEDYKAELPKWCRAYYT
jgi:hypothetical protein